METVLLFPVEDLGPNQYSPTPNVSPHSLNVDEDPHNGDADYLSPGGSGQREVWRLDVSAIPDGSTVLRLVIRSAEKSTTVGANTYRVGFQINGLDYFSPNHVLGAGSTYSTFDDEVAADPSDGESWTKDRAARAFLVHEQVVVPIGLPRPRLSQCVVLADIIPPGHPHAGGTSQAPRAGVSSTGPGARAGGQAPRSSVEGQAPRARPSAQAARTSASNQAPAARVSISAPRALTPADLPTLRARIASQTPRAAVSAQSPQASISPQAPRAEGE